MKIKHLEHAVDRAKAVALDLALQRLQGLYKQVPTWLGKRLHAWPKFLTAGASWVQAPPANSVTLPHSRQLLDTRFAKVRPLPVFLATTQKRRVVLVIDEVPDDVLADFSRVAVVFATLFAKHLGADLRILTRQAPFFVSQFRQLLQQQGVDWQHHVDFLYAPYEQAASPIDLGADDVFVTTNWCTTASVRQSVNPKRIVYLLQEDERLQYAVGDDLLRCEDMLLCPDIRYVVKSQSLYQHFCETWSGHHMPFNDCAAWFEPTVAADFSMGQSAQVIVKLPKKPKKRKYNFLFTAFPQEPAYLYYRGLEVIQTAIEQQLLNEDAWNFYFLGTALQEVVLVNGIRPQLCSNLSWDTYVQLLQSVDVGLSLSCAAWPTDISRALLACGAVVVSNYQPAQDKKKPHDANRRYGVSSKADLLKALQEGIHVAKQIKSRADRVANQTTWQDWSAVLLPVFKQL